MKCEREREGKRDGKSERERSKEHFVVEANRSNFQRCQDPFFELFQQPFLSSIKLYTNQIPKRKRDFSNLYFITFRLSKKKIMNFFISKHCSLFQNVWNVVRVNKIEVLSNYTYSVAMVNIARWLLLSLF